MVIRRRTPLKRGSRLSPVSGKRKQEMVEYGRKRKAFLRAHPFCQAAITLLGLNETTLLEWGGLYKDVHGVMCSVPPSCDIHHVKGRLGGAYLDESTWLAVCRDMHRRIHDSPSWARAVGLLA